MTLNRSIGVVAAVALVVTVGCIKKSAAVTGPFNCSGNTTLTAAAPQVSPVNAVVGVGDTVRFHATMQTCAGIDSVHFTWATSDSTRMLVNAQGLGTALARGTVVVTATYTQDKTMAGAATATIGPGSDRAP